jgi:uncharacterized protein (DUF1684 family)
MKTKKTIISGVVIYLTCLLTGCTSTQNIDPAYHQEVEDWHAKRIASLSKSDGWLSLAGLYWLKEGKNTFGASASNQINFPANKSPKIIGYFLLRDGNVSVQIKDGISVYHNGNKIKTMSMLDDSEGPPSVLTHGSLSWYILKRGDRYGVRLKDSDNSQIKNFKGIERFPVNPKWKIKAQFQAYDKPQTIEIPNVLGSISNDPSPGKLRFELDGQKYSLDPIADPDDKRWFIIFSDKSSGEDTYGAGRFLYIDAPGEDGTTIIDFNKAYNPPCAFTPYATCPLPPEQNHLAIAVKAGEKNYHGYDH